MKNIYKKPALLLFIGGSLLSIALNTTMAHAHEEEHHHEAQHEMHHQHEHENHHEHKHHHEQHAHEHGVAQMQMVAVENDILIEVDSPLYNVVGFEHAPNNAQQTAAFEQQLKAISKGNLFTINPEAQCHLESQKTQQPIKTAQSQKQESHEQTHKNIRFEYQLHCKKPANIREINAQPLFASWTNLQTLKVEWIYNHTQSANTLSRNQPLLLIP